MVHFGVKPTEQTRPYTQIARKEKKVMRKCKFIRFSNEIKRKVLLYASFPHMWLAGIILVLAIVALAVSVNLDYRSNKFWSSIFANIFAGLLTGLILCLISGAKQVSVGGLKSKKCYLEDLRLKIQEYYQLFNALRAKPFSSFDGSEELFNFIYDTGSHANWINEFILQSSFDKKLAFSPCEYCKKKFQYDAYALANAYEELHDNLCEIDIQCLSKKDILGYFKVVDKEIRKLSSAVYREIQEIDIRLEAINRAIF